MKGHVQTPPQVAKRMVDILFQENSPKSDDRILFPGCGEEGPFISAVFDYFEKNGHEIPDAVAFETHPDRFDAVRYLHEDRGIDFRNEDFLNQNGLGRFDFVVGNPPYVPIEDIEQKAEYQRQFKAAYDRFDLYMLFYEQALRFLADGGRLCYITPEKFEYTDSSRPLRSLMANHHVERIEHLDEDTFEGYSTYPVICTISNSDPGYTIVKRRDGIVAEVTLPVDGQSWAPSIRGGGDEVPESGVTLEDVSERISCGIATGRDNIYVQPGPGVDSEDSVPQQLVNEGWTYPTISGKQLRINGGTETDQVIVCPYDSRGNLVPEDELGSFKQWAELHREELESRSCVQKKGKPWYSWHERPPMKDIMGEEKIIFRDLVNDPEFWLDQSEEILPRHSVYYLIPRDFINTSDLLGYLNSEPVKNWIQANCQRASNGYYRLQSNKLKDLPVPQSFGKNPQMTLAKTT